METYEMFMEIGFLAIMFLLIFIITYWMNLNNYKKRKYTSIGELNYLLKKFNLDRKKLPVRKMLLVFSLLDAFIMAFTASFITALPVNTVFQMLIGFVLLFALIYALYEIYGRHLVKKYKKKEGK
jgi:preprotein translocase subunit YajC|uniref:hypothetical protein n=1 Tax=Candidatus Ventrenecus sp. TaxID=3085654 RepID=UPI003FED7847